MRARVVEGAWRVLSVKFLPTWKEVVPEIQGPRQGLPENKALSPRPEMVGRLLGLAGKGGRQWVKLTLNPSLPLSSSTVLRASKKWQPPSLPKSSFAPCLLTLLRLLSPQALHKEGVWCSLQARRAASAPPKPCSQPGLWSRDDVWPALLRSQLCWDGRRGQGERLGARGWVTVLAAESQ